MRTVATPTIHPRQYLYRLWQQLPLLQEIPLDPRVDQLEHSLQCASRAWRDGATREWILCALFHDFGRIVDDRDHAAASAKLLQPLLGAETLWVLANHDIFMLRHAPLGAKVDRESRRYFVDHPWFASAAYFADTWDCRSFDPNYPTLPMNFFEPLLFDFVDYLPSLSFQSTIYFDRTYQ